MNHLENELYVTDCPVKDCHFASDPLPTVSAAIEARRKHVSEHTHGELVDHVCAIHNEVTRYEKSETSETA